MKLKLLTSFLALGLVFNLMSQPLGFEQNVEIHRLTLNAFIIDNHFSNDTSTNVAYRYYVNTVCDHVLNNYAKTNAYTVSLDLLRSLLMSSFVSQDTSVMDKITYRLHGALARRYRDRADALRLRRSKEDALLLKGEN